MTYEYRIIDGRAPLAPAECILTGSKSDPLIDTGKTIRFYGRVYISAREFAIMAHQFGFLSPSQAESLKTDLDSYIASSAELAEENGRLNAALDSGLTRLRAALVADPRSGDGDGAVGDEAGDGPGDELDDDSARADGDGPADGSEPAVGEGRDGVHADAVDDSVRNDGPGPAAD